MNISLKFSVRFLIAIAVLFGCQSNQTKKSTLNGNVNKDLVFKVDSLYIMNYVQNTSIPIRKLSDPIYGRNESTYSLLKEKAHYYELKKIDFGKDYYGRIIGVDFPDQPLDGVLKIIFFATYDKSDHELSSIRLAKYEMVSDIFAFETGIINGEQIQIKRRFSTVDYDETVLESYHIDANGQIRKNNSH